MTHETTDLGDRIITAVLTAPDLSALELVNRNTRRGYGPAPDLEAKMFDVYVKAGSANAATWAPDPVATCDTLYAALAEARTVAWDDAPESADAAGVRDAVVIGPGGTAFEPDAPDGTTCNVPDALRVTV